MGVSGGGIDTPYKPLGALRGFGLRMIEANFCWWGWCERSRWLRALSDVVLS